MRTKTPLLLVLFCAILLVSGVAQAQEGELETLQAQANEMIAQVEQAAQTYNQTLDDVQRISDEVSDNEALLAEIEAKLPEQRARTAASVKSLYLFQQSRGGLLDILLSSHDLSDFISTIRYFDSIHARNVEEIQALTELDDRLTQTQAELTAEHDAAQRMREKALQDLKDIREARSNVQEQINTIKAQAEAAKTEEAREQATIVAAAASEAANKAVADLPAQVTQLTQPKAPAQPEPEPEATQQPEPEQKSEPEKQPEVEQKPATEPEPATPEPEQTEPEQTKSDGVTQPDVAPIAPAVAVSSEVDSWAARIDAYLEGSPLAGYGQVFAQAAAEYGVDPRISPAISCVESGKGAVCFLPHNAWGWGSYSWPDWETAIHGHVSGFASGYGSTITLEGARIYASNDIYREWYTTVLSEMSSI